MLLEGTEIIGDWPIVQGAFVSGEEGRTDERMIPLSFHVNKPLRSDFVDHPLPQSALIGDNRGRWSFIPPRQCNLWAQLELIADQWNVGLGRWFLRGLR